MGRNAKTRNDESGIQPSEWSRIIGTHSSDDEISRGREYEFGGYNVRQTSDGGYVVVGDTQVYASSMDVTNASVFLVKIDSNGNMLWSRAYDSGSGRSVQQTTDGGYIIAGTSYSKGFWHEIYLIKTDSEGNKVWSKTFNGRKDRNVRERLIFGGGSVQQTADGGYIIAGKAEYHERDEWLADVYLVKTDSEGNELWSRAYGRGSGHSVQQTTDGGYIIAGRTPIPDSTRDSRPASAWSSDVYLIKTDSEGNEDWHRTYRGGSGRSVQQTADGGYMIAGNTSPLDRRVSDVYLIKTDSEGNEDWHRTYGRGSGHSVQQTADGGYMIAGNTYSPDTGAADVYLIKTDSEGNEDWHRTYGGVSGRFVQQTADGGYIIIMAPTAEYGVGACIYLTKLAPVKPPEHERGTGTTPYSIADRKKIKATGFKVRRVKEITKITVRDTLGDDDYATFVEEVHETIFANLSIRTLEAELEGIVEGCQKCNNERDGGGAITIEIDGKPYNLCSEHWFYTYREVLGSSLSYVGPVRQAFSAELEALESELEALNLEIGIDNFVFEESREGRKVLVKCGEYLERSIWQSFDDMVQGELGGRYDPGERGWVIEMKGGARIYAGIPFTTELEANALDIINNAGFSQIWMIPSAGKGIIYDNRPWSGLEVLADTRGIGSKIMESLKSLSTEWKIGRGKSDTMRMLSDDPGKFEEMPLVIEQARIVYQPKLGSSHIWIADSDEPNPTHRSGRRRLTVPYDFQDGTSRGADEKVIGLYNENKEIRVNAIFKKDFLSGLNSGSRSWIEETGKLFVTQWRPTKNPSIEWCPAGEAAPTDVAKAESEQSDMWSRRSERGTSIFRRRSSEAEETLR